MVKPHAEKSHAHNWSLFEFLIQGGKNLFSFMVNYCNQELRFYTWLNIYIMFNLNYSLLLFARPFYCMSPKRIIFAILLHIDAIWWNNLAIALLCQTGIQSMQEPYLRGFWGEKIGHPPYRARFRNLVNFPLSFPLRDLPVWILLK